MGENFNMADFEEYMRGGQVDHPPALYEIIRVLCLDLHEEGCAPRTHP